MKNSKLLDILHILIHMADVSEALTSEKLAQGMKTNPVVVRRVMSGLRKNGLVTSEKGHGGGWKLCCDLSRVTLLDIYSSVGSPSLWAIGSRSPSPECQVEQIVNLTTQKVLDEAESHILERFGEITVADLSHTIKQHPQSH